jgi:Ti-type conjugative transfer relaxase TraA
MARVLSRLHEAGAKAVLIGDAEQLQPIEAGAAFRAIAERTGYQELTGIRRQQALWQREASQDFARGDAASALNRYYQHGAIRFAATREQVKDQLIQDWAAHGATRPEKSSLILAHTRADVEKLNQRARSVLKDRRELRSEVKVETWREVTCDDGSTAIESGERSFAPGDRVMFLKNDRELGVKNGSLGTAAAIGPDSMRVILDGKEQREVSFAFRDYGAMEYGYAATVHKVQGATVDHVFVLATPGMDRHLAYVGMTRHREEATLYAGKDDFKSFEALKDRLSRARPKDTTLDYAQRRGLERAAQPNERQADRIGQPEVDAIERFKRAQREFIKVAGRFDLDRQAKARAAELRQEMKWAAEEISRSAGLMREAERAGIGGQVRSLNRENQRVMSKEKGFEMER